MYAHITSILHVNLSSHYILFIIFSLLVSSFYTSILLYLSFLFYREPYQLMMKCTPLVISFFNEQRASVSLPPLTVSLFARPSVSASTSSFSAIQEHLQEKKKAKKSGGKKNRRKKSKSQLLREENAHEKEVGRDDGDEIAVEGEEAYDNAMRRSGDEEGGEEEEGEDEGESVEGEIKEEEDENEGEEEEEGVGGGGGDKSGGGGGEGGDDDGWEEFKEKVKLHSSFLGALRAQQKDTY